ASSTMTNCPFVTSKPRTISSCETSRSCVGHQRFCLIGVAHSRCRSRKETSDWRAAGFVAGARPTGMETSPKLRDPFQVVLIAGTLRIRAPKPEPLRPASKLRRVTETVESAVEARPDAGRRTIARLWRDAVGAGRTGPAYLVETTEGWHEISWQEAAVRAREYANGLLARGVRKGDTFALLARNSLDWALLDFALARVGAVGIPVYASSSSRDVGYLLAHSEAVGIVCEDAEQLAKVEAVAEELPALEHVLTYHDLDGLATHGRDFADTHPTALDEATSAIEEDDLFTII